MIALASDLYGSHTLSAADANTIQCKVTGGVTYVPIPTGAGENFAGLFTVDLPSTIVTGQEFNIIVRRISTRQTTPNIPLHSLPSTVDQPVRRGRPGRVGIPAAPEPLAVVPRKARDWRYVVGTFQIKIPVTTGESMLLPEENTLAIMKWRLEQMAPSNRWYPVLQRYIDYISARVDGLGGDSAGILPSPNGVPPESVTRFTEREYTGRVCEVVFDCFGAFTGFVLNDCKSAHTFKTRERGIEEIVLRACKERLLVSVYFETGPARRILRLVIRC